MRHGKLILAILISHDIAVIPIMLLLPVLTGTGSDVISSLMTLGTDIAALVVVVLGVALVTVPSILDVVSSRRNLGAIYYFRGDDLYSVSWSWLPGFCNWLVCQYRLERFLPRWGNCWVCLHLSTIMRFWVLSCRSGI